LHHLLRTAGDLVRDVEAFFLEEALVERDPDRKVGGAGEVTIVSLLWAAAGAAKASATAASERMVDSPKRCMNEPPLLVVPRGYGRGYGWARMLTERPKARQRWPGRVRAFAAARIKKAAAVSRGGFRVCGGQLHKQNSRHCWRLLSEESS
jgi:hypothetical protein